MRCFGFECNIPYSWEDVTKAHWNKYPNDIARHVVSVDVLRRELNPETLVLRTERLIGVQQPIPRWLAKILRSNGLAYCREVSELDLKRGELTLRTRNIDHALILTIFERVTYRRVVSSPFTTTRFIQNAIFKSELSLKTFSRRIEDFSYNRFSANADIGRKALESVLQSLSSPHQK